MTLRRTPRNATTLAARLDLTPDNATGRDLSVETFTVAAHEATDGTVIAGLVFQTDYAAEQEYGVGDLLKLSGPDPRAITLPRDRTGHSVQRFADVTGLVISRDRRRFNTLAWGEDLETGKRESRWGDQYTDDYQPDYVLSYDQRLPWAQGYGETLRDVQQGWLRMDLLRAAARKVGVSPMPPSKAALTEAILTHSNVGVLTTPTQPDRWPAWFKYGRDLVLRADTGRTAAVLDLLGDAADRGTLAIGNFSGPFATGLFLWDAADETDAIRKNRSDAADWYEARIAELEPVKARLKEMGHGWYALGRPRTLDTGDGRTIVRYWLNGHGSYRTAAGRHVAGQPYGWYTLDELLAEKFVDDLDARQQAVSQ
jgi:hypothetical protein